MSENATEYQLEDIKVGLKKTFFVIVTEEMMNDFAKLSGDHNPLHMNENYAKSTSFKQRVCHGMLLASFFSRLVGMYLPGKNALYLTQSLKFTSPCFLNEKVIVEGEVLSVSTSTKIIAMRTTITKDDGKRLVEGEAKVLLRT